jgi:hypothetical protein
MKKRILMLLTVVALMMAMLTMSVAPAFAGCERGAAGSHAFEQSKGKCFDRGTF